MATTYTTSATRTETRIRFILNHFRTALCRLTDYNEYDRKKILAGIEREEIESLEFIGYRIINGKRVVFVRLKLGVKWDEHHRLVTCEPVLTYDSKFDEGCSPEIYGFIALTQDVIKKEKLEVNMLYTYTDAVSSNREKLKNIREKYGTSPCTDRYDYSRLSQKEKSVSNEAPELFAECHL